MGQGPSQPTGLQSCLNAVCNGRTDCVAYPSTFLYQVNWVDRYNLAIPVEPIAVVRPQNTQDVSGFVKCAADNNVKVQAKSGGHSYANNGVGGEDGALAIDLRNMQKFEMDRNTWQVTLGPGHKLSSLDDKLHDNGKRAISHGTCPSVGLGGHATIGGLGPSSRMWGSMLDHVLEVEVVTADGTIQRANKDKNSDLFFAVKGAGASFGVVTEFVMRTQPEPGSVVSYTYSLTFSKHRDLAPVFKQWQDLVKDPKLDRRFSTEFIMHELGVLISATFFGTQKEYEATGIPKKIPAGSVSVVIDDWLAVLTKDAEHAALWLSEASTPFTARSLSFKEDEMLTDDTITKLMNYIDGANRGTLIWFLIFDSTGGAISDVPTNATAYAHRDKIMFCQGYGIGIPTLQQSTKDFVSGIVTHIQNGTDAQLMTYPGYVDPLLKNAQSSYWGSNLPRLGGIKAKYDPKDVFHNPQSVRPDTAVQAAPVDSGTHGSGGARRIKKWFW